MSNNTATIKTRKNLVSTRTITMTALLAAISYVLAFLEFPVPLSPSFARMDLSDLPALIGAFAFGPVTGVMIELIKNILQLLSTSTGGIGELANFLMGASYVLAAGFIYKYKKTKKMAKWACVISSVAMGIAAAIANYFILLEEENIVAIYAEDSRETTLENILAAMPYMDEDMRQLAAAAVNKLQAMTDSEFSEREFILTDEE